MHHSQLVVDLGHLESLRPWDIPSAPHPCGNESLRCDIDPRGGENAVPSTQDRPRSQPAAAHSQSPAVALDGNSMHHFKALSLLRKAHSQALRELWRERYNESLASKDTAAAARPLQ